jgi:type II secretory pathway component PulK
MNRRAGTSGNSMQRRGSVIIIVLWAIAIAALVTTSVQLFSHRQATLGREALERVQARWAARSGIEYTMAVMRDYTEQPDPDDANAMTHAMEVVAQGQTLGASWDIQHHVDGRNLPGPMDEHSKLNLNKTEDRQLLMALDDMTFDIYDAINDWIDPDNDASALGVERDYYQGLSNPYEPRNGPLRSTSEMELIAGVWPQYFRGEDWNLDGRLDPNENDGRRSFPNDNADGRLDAGWSGALTVYSVAGGATVSGQPRICLKNAAATDLTDRFALVHVPISDQQAQYLIDYGRSPTNKLERLLTQPPSSVGNGSGGSGGTPGGGGRGGSGGGGGGGGDTGGTGGGGSGGGGSAGGAGGGSSTGSTPGGGRPGSNQGGQSGQTGQGGKGGPGGQNGQPGQTSSGMQAGNNTGANQNTTPSFSAKQLQAILDETSIEDPYDRLPGKININTVPAPLLRDIVVKGMGLDDAIADELIYTRDSRAEGLVNLQDFLKVPGIDSRTLDTLITRFGTSSNVFTISSRGRSWATGVECEIVVVVDRSTVPIRIIEYREQ